MPTTPAPAHDLTYVATEASSVEREDNLTRTLERESGDDIRLGEVAVGEEQRVKLLFPRSAGAEFSPLLHGDGLEREQRNGNRGRQCGPVRSAGAGGWSTAGE